MDPIADFLIRIKNAGAVGKETVTVPYSELKFSIAKVLEKEGFLKNVSRKGKKVRKYLEAEIVYEDAGSPKIKGVERVSKLSKRRYVGSKDVRPVKHGYGRLILSTPKGILTGDEAKKQKVGGEALFKVW